MKLYGNLFLFTCSMSLAVAGDRGDERWRNQPGVGQPSDTVSVEGRKREEGGGEVQVEPIGKRQEFAQPGDQATIAGSRQDLPAQVDTGLDVIRSSELHSTAVLNLDKAPQADVLGQNRPEIASYGGRSLAEWHDEVRLMMGEDAYAKMSLVYFELKSLDNWIDSTLAEYVHSGQYGREGLDELVRTELVFFSSDDARLQPWGGKAVIDLQREMTKNRLADYQQQTGDSGFQQRSRFFALLQYVTIRNALYLLLSIGGIAFLIKAFKFMIRQR